MAYSAQALREAQRQVASILHKCEQALLKQRVSSPQHTLLTRRIEAMKIAHLLIEERLQAMNNEHETQ